MRYAIVLGSVLAACCADLPTFAQPGDHVQPGVEVIQLWQGPAPGSAGYEQVEKYDAREDRGKRIGWVKGVSKPTLTVYRPTSASNTGTGIVICPGGGYGGLAIDHEGHVFAEWFAQRGVVAAVLKYRHGGGQHQQPVPLSDAQRALRILRSRAEQWQLKNDRIGIAGFSAGGHLASSAGTHFDDGDTSAEDPIERESCRANFMVLVYPVITMQNEFTHQGSKRNLLGTNPSEDLVTQYSNELHVSADTGPTFLTHAADDRAVPVQNALRFYEALCNHGVPADLHIYASGGHGYGMFRGDRPVDQWPNLLEAWLQERELIP